MNGKNALNIYEEVDVVVVNVRNLVLDFEP